MKSFGWGINKCLNHISSLESLCQQMRGNGWRKVYEKRQGIVQEGQLRHW